MQDSEGPSRSGELAASLFHASLCLCPPWWGTMATGRERVAAPRSSRGYWITRLVPFPGGPASLLGAISQRVCVVRAWWAAQYDSAVGFTPPRLRKRAWSGLWHGLAWVQRIQGRWGLTGLCVYCGGLLPPAHALLTPCSSCSCACQVASGRPASASCSPETFTCLSDYLEDKRFHFPSTINPGSLGHGQPLRQIRA